MTCKHLIIMDKRGVIMAGARQRKKNENRIGRVCITCIVFIFAVVMSLQIIKIYHKDQEYQAKQQELEAQLTDEQQRQEDLKDYEAYMNSQQYVEDTAKSKLGLLYKNEIVFKEKK